MKFIIFFIFVPLVQSELHRFMTAYTEISGQKFPETPEFFAVTTLDGHQIDYYSNIMKLKPKQAWMKKFASSVMWKDYAKIREDIQQIYKTNVHVLMEQFNNSDGVHTFQRMFGCDWDDETGARQGFDQYGYDGEDFISLDLKEFRYTNSVQKAMPTVMKWNNDRTRLDYLKRYYELDCVYWLKELLHLSKATFKKAEPPKVSLLQKKQGNYTCHVTGFLFRNTIILWRKNGETLNDSSKLESGDTLPNEDETFQRRLNLHVLPDEYKVDHYTCVVEHKSLTETIQKTMTVDNTSCGKCGSYASYIKEYLDPVIILVIVLVIFVLIVLCVRCKHQKKIKDASKKIIDYKNKPLPSEQKETQISIPSEECKPLQESVTSEGAAAHGSFTDRHRITFQNLHLHSSSPVERSSQP